MPKGVLVHDCSAKVYFDKRKHLIFASVFRWCEVLKQAKIGAFNAFIGSICTVTTLYEDGLLLLFVFQTEDLSGFLT